MKTYHHAISSWGGFYRDHNGSNAICHEAVKALKGPEFADVLAIKIQVSARPLRHFKKITLTESSCGPGYKNANFINTYGEPVRYVILDDVANELRSLGLFTTSRPFYVRITRARKGAA